MIGRKLKINAKTVAFYCIMALIGATTAFFLSANIGFGFKVSQNYFVSSPLPLENSHFSPEDFTDSLVALINSGAILPSAADLAVSSKKQAPLVFSVTLISANKLHLENQVASFETDINEKISGLTGQDYKIKSINSMKTPEYFALNKPLLSLLGTLIGLTVAFISTNLNKILKL